MKTFSAKASDIERKWVVVDAKGQTLGRLSTAIANIIRGKGKPEYTPHIDSGDFVIVINAKEIQVTGKKRTQKEYKYHTGFIGHLKVINFEDFLAKSPAKVIRHAVWGMIPHNRLGRQQITKLYVYDGPEHPHAAQKPELLAV